MLICRNNGFCLLGQWIYLVALYDVNTLVPSAEILSLCISFVYCSAVLRISLPIEDKFSSSVDLDQGNGSVSDLESSRARFICI